MKPMVDVDTWRKRIGAARRRREQFESTWAAYARLHTTCYQAVKDKNDDALVHLPSGDQVKVGAVFRNIEQTMALLELPAISIDAKAEDVRRELGMSDTHRETLLAESLTRSMRRSGLLERDEVADDVKRDGVVVGHGISFSYWRSVKRQVPDGMALVMERGPDGALVPALDKDGLPVFEPVQVEQTAFEGVQDEYVSPLEFLFDSAARSMRRAPWHGREVIRPLAQVRADERYTVPAGIEGSAYRIKNLYGAEPSSEEVFEEDSVRLIQVWDKANYEQVTLLEHNGRRDGAKGRGGARQGKSELVVIGVEPWPMTFEHPDDSPFSFFIPIPANDLPFGISQIEAIRNQGVELDKIRTRQANITRQIKRIPVFKNGAVDPDQVRRAYNGPDVEPVVVTVADGEKLSDLFDEIATPSVHADLYNQQQAAERDVDKTTGISDVAGGGANTATESEHIFSIGNARATRKRRWYLSYLREVAFSHKALLREFGPVGQKLKVFGPDGQPVELEYGREAFDGEFSLDVNPGGEAAALSPVERKGMIEAANLFLGRFGPVFDKVFARQVLTKLNFRDVNTLLQAVPADVMSAIQMGQMPGSGQRPPGADIAMNAQTDGQALQGAFNAPVGG